MKAAAGSILALVFSALAFADGGALIFRQQAGPLFVSVFASPTPVRAGRIDVSLLLQNASDSTAVLDGQVMLRLSLQGQPDITANATHLNAANKLLFAAEIDLPAPGDWRLSASGTQLGQRWQASGTLHVLSEEPAAVVYWPYFALVPACIALFVLNQYLKRQRLRRRLQ